MKLLRPALLALIAAAPLAAAASELPLWEAGTGVAAIDFPDYRGSDERRSFVLPLPYFVYRGDILKADRGNVRGQFFKNDRVDLHLSVGGSIPVDSEDNAARRGMPDLDPTLEIGPNLEINLLRAPNRSVKVDLRLPVRSVIAIDFSHARDVGWVFEPQLNVDFRDIWPGPGWNLGIAAGPLYGDRRYHNYFYGVAREFATPDRPAYQAHGGYGGAQLIGAISKRFPSFWAGAFVRYDTLSGSTFETSPLVRQKESFAAGLGIAWIFARSTTTVSSQD